MRGVPSVVGQRVGAQLHRLWDKFVELVINNDKYYRLDLDFFCLIYEVSFSVTRSIKKAIWPGFLFVPVLQPLFKS